MTVRVKLNLKTINTIMTGPGATAEVASEARRMAQQAGEISALRQGNGPGVKQVDAPHAK